MTVTELITKLQNCDPNAIVKIWEYQGDDNSEVVEATTIEVNATGVVII